MKRPLLRFAGFACGVFVASSLVAKAEYVVVRGTTSYNTQTLNYLTSTNVTRLLRDTTKLQYIGSYSSLGNTGYAYYNLNTSTKQAFKSTGNFDEGPSIFPNYNGSLGYEAHKQFNGKWWEDIPGLGDTMDIRNTKLGTLEGPRRLVPLREAGFSIQVAPKLSGFHTETRCSWDFGIDPSAGSGYSTGRFFQVIQSRSSVKLDVKLTDRVNFLGGSLLNAITTIEGDLTGKGYNIVDIGPLPN